MNSNKMFFFFILFFSTMITISSNSWLGCWIGLEINLLSFITIISNPSNLMSSEACLKYFLVQAIASMNFLFFILLNLTLIETLMNNNLLSIMINSSLLMKMGAAPFHFWFPNIIEGMSWMNSLILMTWQKIAPIILLSYYYNSNFIIIIVIMTLAMGAIGGLNQTSLRKLMTFSSINHLGWMIMAILISEPLWIFYFLTYTFLVILMCFMFYHMNSFYINQMFSNNFNNTMKLILFLNILSLGGLPPFLGFMPKWVMINFMMYNNQPLLTLIFVMFALITLIFYIRITYASFMFSYSKIKFFNIFFKNSMSNLMNFLSFISLSCLMTSTLMFYLI